MKKILTVEIIH